MNNPGQNSTGGMVDDYALLVTPDPAAARRYDMHNEVERVPEGGGP